MYIIYKYIYNIYIMYIIYKYIYNNIIYMFMRQKRIKFNSFMKEMNLMEETEI